MSKVSRPKKFNSKKERIEIRLSEEEMFELECCSSETGLSKSEIIRNNIRVCCNLAKHQSKKQ